MNLPLPLNAVPTAQIAIPLSDLPRSGPRSDADLPAEPVAIAIPEDFEAALAGLEVPDLATVPAPAEEQPPIAEAEPNADAEMETDAETQIEAVTDLPDRDSESEAPLENETVIPAAKEERGKLPSESQDRLSQSNKQEMPLSQHPEPQRTGQPEKPTGASQGVTIMPAASNLQPPDPRQATIHVPVADIVIPPVSKDAKPDMPDRPMSQETPAARKSSSPVPAATTAPIPPQKHQKVPPAPFMVSSAPGAEAPDHPAPLPTKTIVRQTPAPAVLPVRPAPVPPAEILAIHTGRSNAPVPQMATNPAPAASTPAATQKPHPAMAVEVPRPVVTPMPAQQPAEVQALSQKAAPLKQSALPVQSDAQSPAAPLVRGQAPANIPEPARLERPEQPAHRRPAAPLPHLHHAAVTEHQPQRRARVLDSSAELPAPAQLDKRAALPSPQKSLPPPVEPFTERRSFIGIPIASSFATQDRPGPPATSPAQVLPQQMPLASLSSTTVASPEADGAVTTPQSDQQFIRLDPVQSTAPTATPLTRAELPPTALRQVLDVTQQMPARPVEISLSPEELGRVRLSVSTADTAVQLIVLAERPETLDLMRRHIALLGQQFQAMGFQDVSFSFSAWAGAQDRNAGSEIPEPQQEDPAEENPQTTATAHIKATGTGLDLRL